MKRILALTMALVIALLLVACGGEKTNKPELDPTNEPVKPDPVEEGQPQEQVKQVSVLDTVTVFWLNEKHTYTVGEQMNLNAYGQISRIQLKYELSEIEYGDDHLITFVSNTHSNGKIGTEQWTYEDGMPASNTYRPNNIYSNRDTVYEIKRGADGSVTEIIEKNTLTDSDDGTVKERVSGYEYTYDGDGHIDHLEYYVNGKVDHTTDITYNEDGNMTVYSSVDPSNGKEYLRVEFTYKDIDDNGVVIPLDGFTVVFNWSNLLSYFL